MIDTSKVTLEIDDGDVCVLYDGWYVVTLTKHGSLMRHTSVGHEDIRTTGDGQKIRLVKE